MAQKLICTWENQSEIRALPQGFKTNFDNLSAEMQVVNLKKLLGIEFYNDIILNIDSTEAKYTNLLDGCDFEISGNQYRQEGLRVFLAHLISAEYQVRGKFHETASGLIIKTDQDYQQISSGAQKQLRNDLYEYAMTFWTEINRFLCQNTSTYTLFGLSSRQSQVYKPKIDKIG